MKLTRQQQQERERLSKSYPYITSLITKMFATEEAIDKVLITLDPTIDAKSSTFAKAIDILTDVMIDLKTHINETTTVAAIDNDALSRCFPTSKEQQEDANKIFYSFFT